VERGDQVEGSRGERDGGDAGASEARAPLFQADSQPDLGQIEAVGAPVAVEPRNVGAGAAAAIEHPRIAGAGEGEFNERGDEGAESAEPEVARFRRGGR